MSAVSANRLRAAVLISGTGSNLQALIDARCTDAMPLDIVAVISNVATAPGLQRAVDAGIATAVVEHTRFSDRQSFEEALLRTLDSYTPDMLLLAGFMRVLTAHFVDRYRGRILNIHPSLLPKYPGLETHRRALEAGDREHGCTVHIVTAELDGGPAIFQGRVPVEAGDSPRSLAQRVLAVEHRIFPLAAGLMARGRITYDGTRVLMDGEPLAAPIQIDARNRDSSLS